MSCRSLEIVPFNWSLLHQPSFLCHFTASLLLCEENPRNHIHFFYTMAITLLLDYFKITAYIWSFHPSPYYTASYKKAADSFLLHFMFPWALTAYWFPQVMTLKSWRNIQGAIHTEGCLTVLNGRIRFRSSLTSPWSTKILKRARPSWQESKERVIELNLLTDNCNDDVMLERFSSVALQIAFSTSFLWLLQLRYVTPGSFFMWP